MSPEAQAAAAVVLTLAGREALAWLLRRGTATMDATPLMQQQLATAVQRLDGVATRFEAVVERLTRQEGRTDAHGARLDKLEARVEHLERERRRGGE